MFGDLSYTGKDITSIRNDILEFIKNSNPDWADFNESSIQMQYTEMLAGVADMLCYYLDSQALETFLATARQKKNINSILKTINYEYEIIGASKGYAIFTRIPHEEIDGEPVYIHDRYLIPKHLKLWTNKNINFLTKEEVSMTKNQMSISVPIVQGEVVKKSFPFDTVRESFRLQISDKPIPLEYVEIENDGFTRVEDAFVLIEGGPYYSVHNDSYNNVYLLFTYDWKRYLPESGDLIVSFIDTIGINGNVAQNLIVNYGDGITILDEDAESDIVELSVNNDSATYGGFSDVDIKKHQANAKNWLMTHNTIVLLSDFETMIRKESWVIDCVCYDWRKDENVVERPYTLKAWLVTLEGPLVEERELTDLKGRLQKITVIPDVVDILNADYKDFSLEVVITVTGSNDSGKEKIRSEVESKLKSWYSWNSYVRLDEETRLKFGLSINRNKLIYDIAGISSSIENVEVSLKEDLYLGPTEFLYCTNIKTELAD